MDSPGLGKVWLQMEYGEAIVYLDTSTETAKSFKQFGPFNPIDFSAWCGDRGIKLEQHGRDDLWTIQIPDPDAEMEFKIRWL